jgi:hypothetical protein
MILPSLAASDGIHESSKFMGDLHFSAEQSKATNPPSHTEASRSLTRPVPANHPLNYPLLKLQQTIGNQGVQRLLHSQPVQGLRPSQGGLLQRKCTCGGTPGVDGVCTECRSKRLQRSSPNQANLPQVSPIVNDVLQSPGETLDPTIRVSMEQGFGHDFSQVRVHAITRQEAASDLEIGRQGDRYEQEANRVAEQVMHPLAPGTTGVSALPLGYDFSQVRLHADARAADSARAVSALAYTVGSDIVFGAGQYAPGTAAGKRLLAHELTHVVQQGSKPAALQRQPAPNVAGGVPTQGYPLRIRSVRDVINFFNGEANYFTNQRVTIDWPRFERLINDWYRMVVNRERMANVALSTQLRAAYTAAIRVLISRAAIIFGKSENDLYRENSGRIPMWAWQTPHYLELGISTPIAQGRVADITTGGGVNFSTNGFNVRIEPDKIDPRVSRSDAQTVPKFDWGTIKPSSPTLEGGRRVVPSFTGPKSTPFVSIQTSRAPGVTGTERSGYGRGKTPEDIAGGQVDPRSTSLGFHEGSHGLDLVEFLENNPPPKFTGRRGMRLADFQKAMKQWERQVNTYEKRMTRWTEIHTDCVGKTRDRFQLENPFKGPRIVLVCPPNPRRRKRQTKRRKGG